MRNILLAIAILALPASSLLAETPTSRKPDKSADPARLLPLKRPGSNNACAAYGPGFVKLEGSDTCVRAGGAISIDAGSSAGVH
jgi:hypothetical protein